MNSLEITKGMFDAVEKTHGVLLEQCAETIKNLFENKNYIYHKKQKGCVFVEYKHRNYNKIILGNDFQYQIWIESLNKWKYFDTWLEIVDWIARFEILMRRF